jgi:hypothetical protein
MEDEKLNRVCDIELQRNATILLARWQQISSRMRYYLPHSPVGQERPNSRTDPKDADARIDERTDGWSVGRSVMKGDENARMDGTTI